MVPSTGRVSSRRKLGVIAVHNDKGPRARGRLMRSCDRPVVKFPGHRAGLAGRLSAEPEQAGEGDF